MYVYNVEKLVSRLIKECGWKRLTDVTPDSFQTWRGDQKKAPKTLNEYPASINAMLNWLVRTHRLLSNPLVAVKQVEERGRERRKRRASTEEQLRRLLSVSGRRRPVYLFALHTGLRRAEIEALLWSDVFLDVPKPYVLARASTTKNHLDAKIWLHGDLVEVLREIRPRDPALDERVFSRVPSMYMFKKDLAAAGIPYKDALGRQADFHSLRHTFGTNLSKAGVLPRVAMELMRHSDLRLTMKVYTDANMLPGAEGIERLPSLIKEGPHAGPHDLVTDCHRVSLDGTTSHKPGTAEGPDGQGVCHDLARSDTKCRK
jgi:integrase